MDEKIIKARIETEAVGAAGARIVKKDVYEAGLDAREILEGARQSAQAILAEADQRRREISESARQEGFRAGIAEWDRALQAARNAQEALDTTYEAEIVRLAVKIAEKIIGEELRTRPEAIVSIARECLRSIRHEHSLTIRVNPKENEEVQQGLESLAKVAGAERRIQIVPDATVGRGGCIVESIEGAIDARLETQLHCLEEILLRVSVRR